MKFKYNRFAVIPILCTRCKRYIWAEPYRTGETWNQFVDRFTKIRPCNECIKYYDIKVKGDKPK